MNKNREKTVKHRRMLNNTSIYDGVFWEKSCNAWRAKIYIENNQNLLVI